jgi:translocation protein SEC62
LWEWDIPKKKTKKKKGDREKSKKSLEKGKAKENGDGSNHAYVEEVIESGSSRPQSRSARIEEVADDE